MTVILALAQTLPFRFFATSAWSQRRSYVSVTNRTLSRSKKLVQGSEVYWWGRIACSTISWKVELLDGVSKTYRGKRGPASAPRRRHPFFRLSWQIFSLSMFEHRLTHENQMWKTLSRTSTPMYEVSCVNGPSMLLQIDLQWCPILFVHSNILRLWWWH